MKIQSKIKFNIGNRHIAKAVHAAGTMAAAAVFGTVIAVIPLSIDGPSLGYNAALAVGNGNGNGGVGQGDGRGATNGGLGRDSSSLGSLNAARANEQGFAHANRQHSPVGALANYMETMVDYSAEYALVDWAAYDLIIADIAGKNLQIEGLEDQIAALDTADPAYDADKLALEGQIATLEGDITGLQASADTLTADLDAATTDAAGYLRDAANKDGLIDGDVVHAVNTLLDGKSTDFSDSDPAIHDAEGSVAEIINPAL